MDKRPKEIPRRPKGCENAIRKLLAEPRAPEITRKSPSSSPESPLGICSGFSGIRFVSPFRVAGMPQVQGRDAHHRLYSRLFCDQPHRQPPQADICSSEASPAAHRLPGVSHGRRSQHRIFFMIFFFSLRRCLRGFRLSERPTGFMITPPRFLGLP